MTRRHDDGDRAPAWPLAVAAGAWLLSVAAGMGILILYAATPGDPGGPPESWPADTTLPAPADRPVLVMMAHPRCPCTRATFRELARLMARPGDRVQAHVLFLRPAGVPEDWWRTDLRDSAASIPGVEVMSDDAGIESGRFRTGTSGHVLLYGTDGRLLFSGGITPARGHAGDNDGLDALVRAIDDGTRARARALVFGCALHDPVVASPGGRGSWKP